MGKVIKSLAIGTIFGVAIGIMVLPELDRKTQRNIRKTRRKIKGVAEDAYDNILDYINSLKNLFQRDYCHIFVKNC